MGIFSFFQRKQSRAYSVVSIQDQGSPKNTPRNYDAMSQQAYQLNVVCYDAAQKVAKALGALDWTLYRNKANGDREEIMVHPLLDLLERPNTMQSKGQFFQSVTAFYQISGNVFIEGVRGTRNQINELWSLPPSLFRVVPGDTGIPRAYIMKYKGSEAVFEVDQITGVSDMLHVKNFHPTNNWWGLSPLEPAFLSIDQHNAAAKWNLGLLQNNARPGGALKISDKGLVGDSILTDEEFDNLKEQIKDEYSGPQNSGKTMLLQGGMEWQQMALSPHDLDWLEGNNQNARNIALAMGVPPVLLNIPGDSTFNNLREAKLSLYEETVIPLAKLIRDEFNRWLVPSFGDKTLELDINIDSIDALNIKREAKFKQFQEVDYLTTNEKREAVGYSPIDGGDELRSPTAPLVPQPSKEDEKAKQDDSAKDIIDGVVIEHKYDDPFDGEIKQVNLITQNEKKSTARKLNALRDFYARDLMKSVEEEYFENIAQELEKINSTEKRFAESQALKAIDKFDEQLTTSLQRAIKRTSQSFGQPILEGGKSHWGEVWETKKESDFISWINFFTMKRATEAAQIIKNTTVKQTRSIIENQISSGVNDGKPIDAIAKSIREEFTQISKGRSEAIARTEVGVASNQASLEAAKSLDIPDLKKEWVTAGDSRVRDDHQDMNGKRVETNEKFILPTGIEMNGPQDPSAPANQVINCRCVAVFSRS